MGGDDIKSLERKLERALSSGTASKERCEDLRTRLAAAERVFAQATTSKAKAEAIETSGSIMAIENIDKLTRKLARAEKESNQVRAVDLRERISRAEDAVKLQAHLTRKLARALRAGDETRVETIHARAKAANITLTSSDDIEEREIWREHGSVVNKASASGVSTSTSTAAILTVGGGGGGGSGGSGAAATAATGDVDPHEGMVLAKNGKWYPKPVPPPPGNTSLLLFYAYVQPPWTPAARAAAISFTRGHLEGAGCGGRLRVALEGFNGTLSGNAAGIRSFCAALASYDPKHFSNIDFKVVDGLSDSKAFRNLKVWPVDTLVNYGFDSTTAPLTLGGTHVSPKKWTELAAAPRTIMVDVRNANESAIGRFAPPPGGAQLLDPHMRRSTEFSDWVDNNLEKLKGADKVLMVRYKLLTLITSIIVFEPFIYPPPTPPPPSHSIVLLVLDVNAHQHSSQLRELIVPQFFN